MDSDTRAAANRSLIYYFLIAILTVGCTVSKNATNKVITDEKPEKIERTLYDLTYLEGLREKMKGNLGEAMSKFIDAVEINPGSDAANYQISQITAMRRDYENALKYGSRAVRLDMKNAYYMINMANIYIERNNMDSATYWIERTVEIEPENENEKYRLGNIYMETGKNEKAEKILQELYEKYIGNEQILVSVINVKIGLGKYEEAEKILINELKKNPGNNRIKRLLAEIYREDGEKEKAEKIYSNMIYEEGISPELKYSYIDFLLENNEYEIALEKAAELIRGENAEREDKIGLIVRLIEDSTFVKNYPDKLIKLGNEIVLENSDEQSIKLMMAEIYDAVGKDQKMIEILKDYVDENKATYYIWEKLLIKLNERGNNEQLIKYADKAARLYNTAPLPKILYAFALIENDEYEKANNEIKKVRILVNNEEQFLVQILSMEAEIEYKQGRYKEAYDKFDKALKIESENKLILNNYAYYLAEENERLDEAEKMIKKVIKEEKNITYLDTYAWVLFKKKKFKEAERVMDNVFESVKVTDAELIEHYGYIKDAVGKCDEAVLLWQAAIKIDGSKDYLIEEIRKCIEKK